MTPHNALLRFLQYGTASTLRTFSIVQIAHLNLAGGGDLQCGATAGIVAIPQRVAGLRANELLFEFPPRYAPWAMIFDPLNSSIRARGY